MGWKHKLVDIYIYKYVAMQDKNESAISQEWGLLRFLFIDLIGDVILMSRSRILI